ncbi:MAG: hypothetical protein NVS1B1_06440 [Candidatus Limnocylindrales bacterium]
MEHRRSTRLLVIAALIVAFGLLAALVGLRSTVGIDRVVYDAAQAVVSPGADVVASVVTQIGNTEVALAIAVIFAAAWSRRAGLMGLTPLLIVVPLALDLMFKTLIGHPRPPGGAAHDLRYLPTVLGLPKVAGSFPSSHVVLTAFLAGLLRHAAPRTSWIGWLGWAVVALVAASRIYLNRHWLSDVIGGALLGTLLALVVVFALESVRAWRARPAAR